MIVELVVCVPQVSGLVSSARLPVLKLITICVNCRSGIVSKSVVMRPVPVSVAPRPAVMSVEPLTSTFPRRIMSVPGRWTTIASL